MNPNMIPSGLRRRPQWVVWRSEQRDGKAAKVPYIPGTLCHARSNDPSTWTTFDFALAAAKAINGSGGVAYALSPDDGFVGIDLDKCAHDGRLEPWAQAFVDTLGSYAEWSPSSTGVHIFVRGALPPHGRRRGKVEMYDRARFLTVTGRPLNGYRRIQSRQAELNALHARVFPPVEPIPVQRVTNPTPDDLVLIERAMQARNGAKFASLWGGDWSGYGSQSEADLALCRILAFWTGGDAERVDHLFRQSSLFRQKWDRPAYADGRTYGQATVQLAIG
jgi:putative DNA primase/helicase